MTTYHELLPATKSSPRNGIRWTPSETTANAGHLLIDTKRTRSEYLVVEFPAHGGRGFRFAKVAGATDPTATSEEVFLSDRGAPYASCSCRGFQRFGGCKHLESVKAILENGWLPDATPVCRPAPKSAECPECGGECMYECENAAPATRFERPHNNGIAPWM